MNNNAGRVLIAAPVHEVLIHALTDAGYECIMHENINQQAAYGLIADCMGVVTSTRLQLDKQLIDAAPHLKWIGRMGSGMEVIDVPYAQAKGIACYSSPEGNSNAVGEHAIGMLLDLIRRITWSHNEIKQGIWKREENRGIELEGKTVGIIGYGHTGAAFAQKLQGFDVQVCTFDKHDGIHVPEHIARCGSLEYIFDTADIVSFHVPLQPDTVHYFNQGFITSMRKPFILVNTSRGKVVDMAALSAGIVSGKIMGACLDVFEQEPLTAMNDDVLKITNELAAMPNVVLTPHIAGYTHEALYKMSKILAEKIIYNRPQTG